MHTDICTVDLDTLDDPIGSPDCMADAACFFYDEKKDKCLGFWDAPYAERRIKFQSRKMCNRLCVKRIT